MRRLIFVVFGILLFLAAPALGQATGNKWIHYETDVCDSILLILQDSSGVDTIKKVTSTGLLDTLIDCDSLLLGMNNFTVVFYDVGDTTKRTAEESFNNTKSGGLKAVGDLVITYRTDLLDSFMFIHEYAGTFDTVIKAAVNGMDTTIVAESLAAGVHNFAVEFLYSGETVWLSASETFHNTRSNIPDNPATSYCKLYGYVYGLWGRQEAYVTVKVSPPGRRYFNSCDSSMILFPRDPYETETDTAGYFEVTVLKSSCLADSAMYTLEVGNRVYRTRRLSIYIPADSATYKVTIR